jgi:hypothetical protein
LFENLRAQLKFLLGDSRRVALEIKEIIRLVKVTPFQLPDIAAARTQLLQFGLLTDKTFSLIADAAAARQVSVQQATNAIINTQQREFSTLKEFGINVTQTLNEVEFTYKDKLGSIKQVIVANSPEAVLGATLDAFSDRFEGQIENFQGLWVNLTNILSKEWLLFQKDIADAGIFDSAKRALRGLLDQIDRFKQTPQYAQLLRLISSSLEATISLVTHGLEIVGALLKPIIKELTDLAQGINALGGLGALTATYLSFGQGAAKAFLFAAAAIGKMTEETMVLTSEGVRAANAMDQLIQATTLIGASGIQQSPLAGIEARTKRVEELKDRLEEIEVLSRDRLGAAFDKFPRQAQIAFDAAEGSSNKFVKVLGQLALKAQSDIGLRRLKVESGILREELVLLEAQIAETFKPTIDLVSEQTRTSLIERFLPKGAKQSFVEFDTFLEGIFGNNLIRIRETNQAIREVTEEISSL